MLVSVDEVKAHLRIDQDEEDLYLESLIRQAQAGIIDAGEFVLYFGAITGFAVFVNSIMTSFASLQEGNISLNHLRSYLELEEEDVYSGSHSIQELQMPVSFTFRNVSFSYSLKEEDAEGKAEDPGQWIFRHLNLTIHGGEKIAIVGKSGQGKSTLFNLLLRYFDASKGTIELNGMNIKDISEKSLRDNISVIRQAPYLFNSTILDNFKIVDENVTLKKVREVAKKAYIDDYIMSLPNKYDTVIGEGGVNLSGGQKQRIAIARTLLKDTKVILFDEATSSLDNESQEYVKKTIDDLVKTHTIIIVAHRLSTIMDADLIYVIDEGKVSDFGTHESLMKSSKLYKKLYSPEVLDF